jgi:aldose 1-epimerase
MAQSWPDTAPIEVRLVAGNAELHIDLRGAALRGLTVGDWAVLDGYPAGTAGAAWRGAVLLPWPNRVRHGRWSWQGQELQLAVLSPEHPHAIHGLVDAQPWRLLALGETAVTLGVTQEPHYGYPFRLAAAVDYRLAPDRLTATLRVRNVGPEPAPVGAGFHPYLAVGAQQDGDLDDAELHLPARTRLVLDGGLPTGERRPAERVAGRIGGRVLDDAFTDLARDPLGWARVRLSGPAGELELAADRAWPWLQVYSGDTLPAGQRWRSLAVEPMTCPPNALADGVDLVVLAPGEEWAGSWTLGWSPR